MSRKAWPGLYAFKYIRSSASFGVVPVVVPLVVALLWDPSFGFVGDWSLALELELECLHSLWFWGLPGVWSPLLPFGSPFPLEFGFLFFSFWSFGVPIPPSL